MTAILRRIGPMAVRALLGWAAFTEPRPRWGWWGRRDSALARLSRRLRALVATLLLTSVLGLVLAATTDWRWVHFISPVGTMAACFMLLAGPDRKPSDRP